MREEMEVTIRGYW